MAAAVLYKGYLIVSHAKQDTWSKRWSVTVDISSRATERPDNTIFTGDEFETQEAAEQWGMQQAREWIDQQP